MMTMRQRESKTKSVTSQEVLHVHTRATFGLVSTILDMQIQPMEPLDDQTQMKKVIGNQKKVEPGEMVEESFKQ